MAPTSKSPPRPALLSPMMALIALGAFVGCLLMAFLPRSPQPPPNIPIPLRLAAGQLSDKYWLVLLLGGIGAVWRRRDFLPLLLLTMAVAQLALSGLKILVGEMRPDGRFFDSFPSGHATASFAFATALLFAFPNWGWFWVMFAALVGISRVVVNAHWWHDVAGGAALGYLVATTCSTLWHRRRQPLSS